MSANHTSFKSASAVSRFSGSTSKHFRIKAAAGPTSAALIVPNWLKTFSNGWDSNSSIRSSLPSISQINRFNIIFKISYQHGVCAYLSSSQRNYPDVRTSLRTSLGILVQLILWSFGDGRPQLRWCLFRIVGKGRRLWGIRIPVVSEVWLARYRHNASRVTRTDQAADGPYVDGFGPRIT